MKRICAVAVLVLGVVAQGCGSPKVTFKTTDVTPSTYKPTETGVERSVGRLRRLAILPIHLEVSPENQAWCVDPCDWNAMRTQMAKGSLAYLVHQRGYEAISLDLLAVSGQIDKELVAKSKELVHHARTVAEGKPVPERVSAMIIEIGTETGMDALLLVHGSATAITWADVVVGGGSFALSIPLSMARVGIKLKADVFEVATGNKVWSCRCSFGGDPFSGNDRRLIERLLDPIEPAIPSVMTEPR